MLANNSQITLLKISGRTSLGFTLPRLRHLRTLVLRQDGISDILVRCLGDLSALEEFTFLGRDLSMWITPAWFSTCLSRTSLRTLTTDALSGAHLSQVLSACKSLVRLTADVGDKFTAATSLAGVAMAPTRVNVLIKGNIERTYYSEIMWFSVCFRNGIVPVKFPLGHNLDYGFMGNL